MCLSLEGALKRHSACSDRSKTEAANRYFESKELGAGYNVERETVVYYRKKISKYLTLAKMGGFAP